LIKIKQAHGSKQTTALMKGRPTHEAFTLLIFVVALGVISAVILDYSFKIKEQEPYSDSNLEGYIGSTLYTDKDRYSPSEVVTSDIKLVNVKEEDMILEQVQYRLSVYALNNDSSLQVFTTMNTVELGDVKVKPHYYFSFSLDETWDQKDAQYRQVPEGKYLIEVQIPSYNLTLSKIIYIKKPG